MIKAIETQLRAVLPEAVFRPITPHYLEEPRGLFNGVGGLCVAPRTVEEVSQIVRLCHEARTPIVPFGGGTGLVGGQVMPDGAPVILSLERMNTIRDVDVDGNTMVAEAGVVLTDVQAAAERVDRLFPLSLASQGSCQIGGCLATNAGGVNVLRYGSARALCLGVEAVLPDGSIHHGLRSLRKDNTGYDLRGLLCGSEGTLGVITAASLQLFTRPAQNAVAMFAPRDSKAALALLSLAQASNGPELTAFELIKDVGFQFLAEAGLAGPQPVSPIPDWTALIELGTGPDGDPREALLALFERAQGEGICDDGIIAQSQAQANAFWRLREEIPLANKAIGSISSHDISLPIREIPAFLARADDAIARLGAFRINAFGHLGDGNLHYNVFPPAGQSKEAYCNLRAAIRKTIYDLVHGFGGSFSAEHGVGRLKTDELQRYGDPGRLSAMRAIKQALDPHNIMNPGAIFPKTVRDTK